MPRPRQLLGACAALALAIPSAAIAQETRTPPPPPPPEAAGKPLAEPGTTAAPPATAAPPDPAAHIRFGAPRPIARPTGALRIAVYNVENLFDDHDDPALSGQHEDRDETKPEAHCKAVAAAIRAIDADVIGLTEIESERALRWFRDKHLAGLGYDHLVSIDAGDERGIEQAVLSRYPLSDVKNWIAAALGGTHPEKWGRADNHNAGRPITFHRSPLSVTVTVPPEKIGAGAEPYRVTLLVVHQKSGAPGGYWREKEAAKTVELIAEMQTGRGGDPDRNIIVMGDFNARPEDKPLSILTGSGLADVFAGVRKRGDHGTTTHESGRVIDYILLNPAAAKELIRETRFVMGTPARPAGVDYRTTPGPEGYASDHYPLVIDLAPKDQ